MLYVCTEFEADRVRSKVMGSQLLDIGTCDPGHAHLWFILWSARRRGRSSMSLPNLKRMLKLFVQKLLGGPKISKLGHVT